MDIPWYSNCFLHTCLSLCHLLPTSGTAPQLALPRSKSEWALSNAAAFARKGPSKSDSMPNTTPYLLKDSSISTCPILCTPVLPTAESAELISRASLAMLSSKPFCCSADCQTAALAKMFKMHQDACLGLSLSLSLAVLLQNLKWSQAKKEVVSVFLFVSPIVQQVHVLNT